MIPASDLAALVTRPNAAIYLEGRLPMLEAQTARSLGLKDGQVIQANAQAQVNQWILRFQNGSSLELPRDWSPPANMAKGEKVTFKVAVLPDGSMVLRPLPAEESTANQNSTAATELAGSQPVFTWPDRLTHLLFRPQEMKSLLDLLQPGVLDWMVRQLSDGTGPLTQWLRNRPSLAHLTGDQLRQWMMQSGWLNESLLGKGKWHSNPDLKTGLRSLLESLRDGGEGNLQQIEAALDDIESSQLQAALSQIRGEHSSPWVLAFQDAPPIQLKISRDARHSPQENSGFVVEINLQSPDLGPVGLWTRVAASSRIEMVMWAEREEVVTLARRDAHQLRTLLQDAGLQLSTFQVVQGHAPQAPATEGKPGQILDVRT